jgi:uncharacterized phage protein (TIGR01671 family)
MFYRVVGSSYEDGPCSIVWMENKKEWVNHDGDISQYTGLKDKTGKEIYEGDILFIPRRLGCPDGDGELYIARWECCGFCFRKKIIIENGKKRKAKPCVLINRAAVERHSEIIGNVYEDSELLEGW